MSNRDTLRMELSKPGDHEIDVPVVCVITRFGLRSPRYLIPTYLDYRRVVKEAVQTRGLLRAAFLVENPTTCYSLSIWSSRSAIPLFGTNVPNHVDAARRVFGRVRFNPETGPEIWSTKWRLATVSNNLNWGEPSFRESLLALLSK